MADPQPPEHTADPRSVAQHPRLTPEQVTPAVADLLGDHHHDLDAHVWGVANGTVLTVNVSAIDDHGNTKVADTQTFQAVFVAGDQVPLAVPRPDLVDTHNLEGAAFADPSRIGWEVAPADDHGWATARTAATGVAFRGSGHISFAEARRMGAALLALADEGEQHARMSAPATPRRPARDGWDGPAGQAEPDRPLSESWTFRIVFGWTGPPAALRGLAEQGVIEQLASGDYAWTSTLTGDLGPGSADERAGRAEWIAQDALAVLISASSGVDQDHGLARLFVHRSTTRVVSDAATA